MSAGRPMVAVIGGGPAGLMAAETLAAGGAAVTVYDRMPSVGRKLLMAGRGGLNLTHSEPPAAFLARYGTARSRLEAAIAAFGPADLRAWSEGLGQETFIGTSGRVFPRAFKASPLLRAWLRRLDAMGVRFALRHHWTGWDETEALRFTGPDGAPVRVAAEAAVLALGGASWPRLGSDGAWVAPLTAAGVAVAPLQPSNCGLTIRWSPLFAERFEGQPLKRLALHAEGRSVRGEAIVTRDGLEGGAIYALSAPLREALVREGAATLTFDLRPDLSEEQIAARLGSVRRGQSLSNALRKAAGLSPAAVGILREAGGVALPTEPERLAALVKAACLTVTGVRPLERAISSAGGVSFEAVDARFMLRGRPGVFVAGEMLDWEAPTGGYLLQATFATGIAAARGALDWLASARSGAGAPA